MATSPQDLLRQGIAAARAGQPDVARQFIAKALQLDPRNEQAWLWLSSVAQSDEERIQILQQLLKINPANEHALKGLQALGALPEIEEAEPAPPEEAAFAEEAPSAPVEEAEETYAEETYVDDETVEVAPAETYAEQPVEEQQEAAPSLLATAAPPPAPDGIPLIEPEMLAYIQELADTAIREGMAQQPEFTFDDVTWVPHTRGRRTRFVLNPVRIAMLIGAILALGAIAVGVLSVLGRSPIQVASGPSSTPTITLTATGTATQTPQATATATLAPNQATFTPEATIPIGVPQGNLDFGITLTPPYFATVHPDNPRLDRAIARYHEGDYAAVIEEIPAARDAGPDLPDSYFFEGMAYAFEGQYDRAAVVVNDGLEQDSNIAALHAALGYIFLRQGSIEESRRENAIAKQLDPVFIMSYLTLAEDYAQAGDFDTALAEIDAALQLDAHNVEVLVGQGNVFLLQDRADSAAAVGNLSLFIDPTSEQATLLLAQARIALGQYDRAVQPLEEYLSRIDQGSTRVWATLGDARFREGSIDKALDAYSRALQIGKDNADVLAQRGRLFLDAGEYQDAFDDFDESLSLADSFEARLGRAQSAFILGDYATTLDDTERVLAETPDDQQMRLIQAQAQVELESYNEALVALDQLILEGMQDLTMLGDAYEYRGRAKYFLMFYGNAINDIEQAIQFKETGTRHYYRGLALEATNNVAGATLEYDWVLFWNRSYSYPFAEDALQRLENLNQGGEPQGALSS